MANPSSERRFLICLLTSLRSNPLDSMLYLSASVLQLLAVMADPGLQ